MSNKIIKKELREYVQTEPTQLKLFDLSDQNSDEFSNTVEFYDSMPRTVFGGVVREKGKTMEGLPILSRDFVYRNKEFKINISPAALLDKKSGKTIHYLPTQREVLVEDVIRKFAATKKKGVYLDGEMAVKFTLYEVEQELKRIGHGYSRMEIKQALEICSKVIVEIVEKAGNQVSHTSALFPFVGKETREMGGQERVVVVFHPLVTKSIDSGTYRTINYERLMRLKMPLASWLYKHISHLFTQAAVNNPYQIRLSTIVKNSGMTNYERVSHMIKQVQKALDELVSSHTVGSYDTSLHKDKNKILDATFSLFMSEQFVADTKKANKLASLRLSSGNAPEKIDYKKLREELEKEIFGLSEIYINNVISKVRSERDFKVVSVALEAAEEAIKKTPGCNAGKMVSSAIKHGWVPSKEKSEKTLEHKEKSLEEIEKERAEQEELKKEKIALQKDPIWINVRKEIKILLGDVAWEKWLEATELYSMTEEEIILNAPSKFIRDWITREFVETSLAGQDLKKIIQKVLPKIQKVVIVCKN